jgi:hypothetical protein
MVFFLTMKKLWWLMICLKVDQSWGSNGVDGPALCYCYRTPVPNVQLAIFAKAKLKVVRDGKTAVFTEVQKVAHIASLDDTVAKFRDGMSNLFSGKIPNELSIVDRNGIVVKLEDSLPLKHYNLLCFQDVMVKFASSNAKKRTLVDVVNTTPDAAASDTRSSSARNDNDNQNLVHTSAVAITSADAVENRKCAG